MSDNEREVGRKSSKVKISVIIPSYNRMELLRRALKSVMAQVLAPSEVIVVDDGSTDQTAAMVTREFPTVRLITQRNQGVSAARNRGIETSYGEWISFLDSDDEWLPEKLSEQATLIQRCLDIKVCHTDEIWIRNGRRVNAKKKHRKPEGWIFDHCLPLCCVSPSTVFIHRSVFNCVGVFDTALPACEDYDLWLRIFARYQVGLSAKPLVVKYGGHEDQLSKRYWGMDRFRVAALQKLLESGILDDQQRLLTINTLTEKCGVLIKGFEKRNNAQFASKFMEIRDRWVTHA